VSYCKNNYIRSDSEMAGVYENANLSAGQEQNGKFDLNMSFEEGAIEELDECLQSGSKYYTLSFNYTFTHEKDQVFIAHHFPYSYSKLIAELDLFEQKARNLEITPFYQVQSLCHAVGWVKKLFFVCGIYRCEIEI